MQKKITKKMISFLFNQIRIPGEYECIVLTFPDSAKITSTANAMAIKKNPNFVRKSFFLKTPKCIISKMNYKTNKHQ